MQGKWTGISLVTEGVALGLHLSALLAGEWISLNAENADFGFALLSCVTCPRDYLNFTPECLLNLDCQLSSSPLCPFAQRLSTARDYYLCAGLLALAITVVTCVNQSYKALGYRSGSKRLVCLLGIGRALASSAAVLLWIGQMKGEIGKRGRLGVGVGLGAGVVMATSISSVAILKGFSSAHSLKSRSEAYPTPLQLRLYALILPFLSLSLTLNTLAYLRPWVHYTSPTPHQGSLLTLDKYLHFAHIDYTCIAGPACQAQASSFDTRHCDSFLPLALAGKRFIWYDGSGFVVELVWLVSAVHLVCRSQFGPRISVYAWAVLAVGLKTMAIWAWFKAAGASLSGDCATEDWFLYIKVCADTGPLYALCHLACLLLSVCLFLAISSYTKPSNPLLPKSLSLRAYALSPGYIGTKCTVCDKGKTPAETCLKLPCSHWLHIHCFPALSYATYRQCPKCTH